MEKHYGYCETHSVQTGPDIPAPSYPFAPVGAHKGICCRLLPQDILELKCSSYKELTQQSDK